MKKIIDIADGVSPGEASTAGRALRAYQDRPARGKRFRVLQAIWHTADERYYQPGEEVDLSHLSADALEVLLEAKVVEEVRTDVHDEGLPG